MKIIIVGAGNVGYSIAQSLSADGHDIVIIENDQNVAYMAENDLDVSVVVGNGSRPSILEAAGLYNGCNVDFLVACTDRDEVNIMACWLAKRYGVKRVISRARGMEYTDSPRWATELGIDVMNSPERSLARDIDDLLAINAAIHTTEFFDGRAGSYAFKVKSSSPIKGKSLSEIGKLYPDMAAIMVYIERNGEGIVPFGDWVVEEGDLCYVVVLRDQVLALQDMFNPHGNRGLKRVVIVGGGKLGSHLAYRLVCRYPDLNVKIIDNNRAKCERLAEEFPGVTVLWGDGTDEKLLKSEGIDVVDGFVATTSNDEMNMVLALLGKKLNARKSIAVVRKEIYSRLAEDLPIDATVNPNESLSSVILRYIRYPKSAGSLSLIERIGAEMIEVSLPSDSPVVGKKIRDVELPRGVLVAMINRSGKVFMPFGDFIFNSEDTLFLFAKEDAMEKGLKKLGISI